MSTEQHGSMGLSGFGTREGRENATNVMKSNDGKRARRRGGTVGWKSLMVLSLAGAQLASAQDTCVSLSASTACPAFKEFSISTNLTDALWVFSRNIYGFFADLGQ